MAREPTAAIGVVGPPHGLSGEVYVQPDPDLGHLLEPGRRCAIAHHEVEIAAVRTHRGRVLVRFDGVEGRDQAEALRHEPVRVPRADVPRDDDDVWVEELVGCEVVDADGRVRGWVRDVIDGPAHDWLVVAVHAPAAGAEAASEPPADATAREVRVPCVPELVVVEGSRLVVADLPGLLDERWL